MLFNIIPYNYMYCTYACVLIYTMHRFPTGLLDCWIPNDRHFLVFYPLKMIPTRDIYLDLGRNREYIYILHIYIYIRIVRMWQKSCTHLEASTIASAWPWFHPCYPNPTPSHHHFYRCKRHSQSCVVDHWYHWYHCFSHIVFSHSLERLIQGSERLLCAHV